MSKYIAKHPDQHGIIHFTKEEDATWKILYERQIQTVKNRACDEFLSGLEKLNLPHDRVPQCKEVSAVLTACTKWAVTPVDTMIPLEEFFTLLSKRQFPAASFIRVREELDYIKEPDIFHELFGHCPLITHQAYADFLEWYGEIALKTDEHVLSLLGRLFWFTIEFGLVNTPKGTRIYGGGILSSHQETIYALESNEPARTPFDVTQALSTPYRYDVIQNHYFVLNNINQLFELKTDKIIKLAESLVSGTNPADDFVIC